MHYHVHLIDDRSGKKILGQRSTLEKTRPLKLSLQYGHVALVKGNDLLVMPYIFCRHWVRKWCITYSVISSPSNMLKEKQTRHLLYLIHTPGNVGVSSKHIVVFSNYSNSVWISITLTVERSWSPAVRGGAVTKLPNMWAMDRTQKSTEMTEEKVIALDYFWLHFHPWKKV